MPCIPSLRIGSDWWWHGREVLIWMCKSLIKWRLMWSLLKTSSVWYHRNSSHWRCKNWWLMITFAVILNMATYGSWESFRFSVSSSYWNVGCGTLWLANKHQSCTFWYMYISIKSKLSSSVHIWWKSELSKWHTRNVVNWEICANCGISTITTLNTLNFCEGKRIHRGSSLRKMFMSLKDQCLTNEPQLPYGMKSLCLVRDWEGPLNS